MKKISCLIIPLAAALCFMSCTKGFEEKNKDPYAITTIDPGLLFTGAERNMNIGSWDGEQTIVQQYINAYNAGATAGFQFNLDIDGYSNDRWGAYTGVIKPLIQIISIVKDKPTSKNLYAMSRIWKAFAFMTLVDTYGDVPYSEAGKAYLEGITSPKYDKMADIYADLYTELKTATADLSATNEYVASDLFFGGAAATITPAMIAAQVAHWKKIGYSLMLRLGMRYSKLDPTKAASIAQEAFTGGVILSNSDNVVVKQYNGTVPNGFSNLQRNISPYFYYLAEPFVTQLKSTGDPRLRYIGASYANPTTITTTPDTTLANQYGFPIGYDAVSFLTAPGSRGTKGGGLNYTQLNYQVMVSTVAPALFITNAQTQLLLAEAKFRGWITSGTTTQQYYEAGVRAAMDDWNLFPGTFSPAVSNTEKDNYLLGPAVAYSDADALKLINTQYWICSITNGPEGFANWRRSGYPALLRNKYNDDLVPDGGFVRRMSYPDAEKASNAANYTAAAASMGGDKITKRVFWDKP
jgi:hypothetical protein